MHIVTKCVWLNVLVPVQEMIAETVQSIMKEILIWLILIPYLIYSGSNWALQNHL